MLAVHSLVQVAQVDNLSARLLLQIVCIDSADDLRCREMTLLLLRSQALDHCTVRQYAGIVATRVLVLSSSIAI